MRCAFPDRRLGRLLLEVLLLYFWHGSCPKECAELAQA